jgi:hypothetical protein
MVRLRRRFQNLDAGCRFMRSGAIPVMKLEVTDDRPVFREEGLA